jgi:hypothetical protein
MQAPSRSNLYPEIIFRSGLGIDKVENVFSGARSSRPNVPWRHPLHDPVPHNLRVKQNRPKVSRERQEKEIGEDRVRLPQHRIVEAFLALHPETAQPRTIIKGQPLVHTMDRTMPPSTRSAAPLVPEARGLHT